VSLQSVHDAIGVLLLQAIEVCAEDSHYDVVVHENVLQLLKFELVLQCPQHRLLFHHLLVVIDKHLRILLLVTEQIELVEDVLHLFLDLLFSFYLILPILLQEIAP